MNQSRLEMLYRTVILEHSKHPKNKGVLENKTGEFELFNPSCGDRVRVQFQLEDDTLSDIRFNGEGCAISMASASMMTELLAGQTVDAAQTMIALFYELVKGNEDEDYDPLKEAQYLKGVSQFPTRIRCATLSWHAIEEGLNEEAKRDEENSHA